MRDENGFKMHCQSPSHMQKALAAGENFKGVQEDYSKAFLRDFIQLLKTGHRDKQIHVNKFYQEYIANKDAVHLNSTKWSSLTEFTKYLGRESICLVEEKDDGLFISWIDDSPEALKRKEALRRKELQDKGDEEREQMLLKAQIRRAQKDAESRGVLPDEDEDDEAREVRELVRQEGEKIKLSFGSKVTTAKPADPAKQDADEATSSKVPSPGRAAAGEGREADSKTDDGAQEGEKPAAPKPLSLKMTAKPQAKNVFKNAFSGGAKKVKIEQQPKKMSEAERIMKEEMERKRARDARGFGGPPNKKQRT